MGQRTETPLRHLGKAYPAKARTLLRKSLRSLTDTVSNEQLSRSNFSLGTHCALVSHVHEGGDEGVHTSAANPDDLRIWTFAKGADELTVEQWLESETVVVALTRSDEKGVETVHAYEFPDESAADEFHAGLDSSLLEFGWSFIGHLPERRMGADRRRAVRRSDRRRWWTDGALILE